MQEVQHLVGRAQKKALLGFIQIPIFIGNYAYERIGQSALCCNDGLA